MSTTAKIYDTFPPKIETVILDVEYEDYEDSPWHNCEKKFARQVFFFLLFTRAMRSPSWSHHPVGHWSPGSPPLPPPVGVRWCPVSGLQLSAGEAVPVYFYPIGAQLYFYGLTPPPTAISHNLDECSHLKFTVVVVGGGVVGEGGVLGESGGVLGGEGDPGVIGGGCWWRVGVVGVGNEVLKGLGARKNGLMWPSSCPIGLGTAVTLSTSLTGLPADVGTK